MQPELVPEIAAARTFLFVPGDRPDRFDKAAASGADVLILDLEDAVAPDAKAQARAAVAAWLSPDRPVLIRVNGADTTWFEDDLALCGQAGVLGIMLPKAEPGAALNRVAGMAPVVALIESARGAVAIGEIAGVAGVQRLAFGTIDLALDLDITAGDAALAPIGLQLVVASRAAGIAPPIDGVTLAFRDPVPVEAAMRHARGMGFGAKMCIHPAQIAPVNDALMPTAAQIAHARRLIDADRASHGAAVALDGQMVDRPVVERAYRLLRQAGIDETRPAR